MHQGDTLMSHAATPRAVPYYRLPVSTSWLHGSMGKSSFGTGWWVLLLVGALAGRCIGLARCAAPARDAVRYFDHARQFDQRPFPEAVRAIDSHPLYPLLLSAMHRGLVAVGWTSPFAWWRTAQALSIAASLGMLTAGFVAGRQVWSPRVAALGLLAIAVTPRQIGYAVDVLADPVLGLFWMSSLAILVSTSRQRTAALSWSIAGLLAGLGYLTHLEGIIWPMGVLGTLIISQSVPAWRIPWRMVSIRAAAFFGVFALSVLPYVCWIGAPTPRLAARDALGILVAEPTAGESIATPFTARTPAPSPAKSDSSLVRRAYLGDEGHRQSSIAQAMRGIFFELGEETRGWPLLVIAAGFCLGVRSGARWPEGLLFLIPSVGILFLSVLLEVRAGYFGGRYLGPMLPFVGMLAIGISERFWQSSWPRLRLSARAGWALVIALALAAVYLPGWQKPIHADRRNHRDAAAWLTKNSARDDAILDPMGTASFFAERPRWDPKAASAAPPRFAVIEPAYVYRCDAATHAAIAWVDSVGECVVTFPDERASQRHSVRIYRIPERFVDRLAR